jgi:uroporphyrinogen decarboxylase
MLTSKAGDDKFVGFHLTGKLHDIMPIMLQAEPDFILRFESPRFGGDCTLKEAKEKWGDKVCIMGGYDPHIFTLGSCKDMLQEAIRCIDEAADGGGYILANTDAIPEEAELEDVKAMVDLTKEYGKY